jgi:hypothetical protein
VKNLALERVTLNLADQSSRSFPIDIEIYDCALRGDVIEQTLELARVDSGCGSRPWPYTTAGTRPSLRSFRAMPLPPLSLALADSCADAIC